ncbi:MAG: hypothetical protein RRB13_02520 [bacterium]|nr:hypothetical protein [bacterium]
MNPSFLFLLAFLALLQLRGDGYFPFPRDWPKDWLLALVLGHLALLWALLLGFIRAQHQNRPLLGNWLRWVGPAKWGVALGAIALIVAGQWLQAQRFAAIGYRWEPGVMFTLLAASLVLVALAFAKERTGRERTAWALLAAAALGLKFYPIFCFPITAERSDMLPILSEAGQAWLSGTEVYRFYLLDNGVETQNVRLPGMIALYLPAVALGLDLRWVVWGFEALVFGALIVLGGRLPSQKRPVWALLLVAFWLLPYWQMRHELYEVPFWLLLMAAFWALEREKLWALAFLLGVMVATLQWGWLFAPFFSLAVLRRWGLKPSLLAGSFALALAGLILWSAVGSHWGDFYFHVFSYYRHFLAQGVPYLMSMYLTALLAKLGALGWLLPMQALGVFGLLGWHARKARPISVLMQVCALALAWMLLWNAVAWTYQYLLVFLLLLQSWRAQALEELKGAD